jgi:diguanylate cyclase (GGDEF)-like protein/PAS domain S-box-containing protein
MQVSEGDRLTTESQETGNLDYKLLCRLHQDQVAWHHLNKKLTLQIQQSLDYWEDFWAILQSTAEEINNLLGCDRLFFYRIDSDQRGQVVGESISAPQWSLLNQTGQDYCLGTHWLNPRPEEEFRAIEDVFNVNLMPCYVEFLAQLQVRAYLVIPILQKYHLWGFLIAHSCTAPRPWQTPEIEGLQQTAINIGLALQQLSLVTQLQATEAELKLQVALQTKKLEQTNQALAQEIQKHNQATSKVAQREEFLRQVLDSLPTFVGVLTPNGILIEANQSPLKVAGIGREEVINKPFAEAYWWAYSTEAQAQIRGAIDQANQGLFVKFDIPVQIQGGGQIIIEFSLNPLRNAAGQITHLIPSGIDITDRKKAELDRLQTEQISNELKLLENILDLVLAGYWDWDIVHHQKYFSPSFKEMLGYADQELANVPETVQKLIFAEDLPKVLACFESHVQSHGVIPYYNEVRYRHKNGSTIWVIRSGKVIEWDDQGNPLRVIGCYINISDRKQAELALQQSEATNQALIQAIPDFLIRMRRDGLQLQVMNEGAIHYIRPRNEQELSYITDILPLDISQERINLANTALTTGQIQRQEYEFVVQGRNYYEEARIAPLWNDEVLVVVRDITSRKQTERELKDAKNQLELVLQASSEGFWDWDLVTGKIYFSPQWKAMLGYADEELENTMEMWNSLIFGDDRVTALQMLEDYNSNQLAYFTAIQRFQHKNGSIVHVLSRAIHLHNDQSQAIRMVGSHLDMTQLIEVQEALKTSEMQLSSILNSSLDGIMEFRAIRDSQGTIIDFERLLSNPTACNLMRKKQEDLIGRRLLEEMPGPQEEGLFNSYVQVVESGKPRQQEFYYQYEGRDYWFQNIAVKLGDGFVVTFRDITAMKQSEMALQQANQELETSITNLQQRHQEMLKISEISDFLQVCLTVAEACHAISNLVEPLFPHCAGGIFILEESHNLVKNVGTWGGLLCSIPEFLAQDCWALRRGRIHLVENLHQGLCCQHVPQDTEIISTLCIPMIAQGETLGLFYLSTQTANALPEVKQQLGRTVAEQLALAIANLRLRETLQNQSIRDPLTGIFNRRYLEEVLIQELAHARRKNHPISLIMLDIDHFKLFNDTYGHEVGDYVLQSVGQLLRESLRDADTACRYGGEEMILVLPEISLAQAEIKAEGIRLAIAQLPLSHNGQSLFPLTVSLGVAAFPQHGTTGAAVIQSADAALYRAKAAGRNQVIVAP